MLWAQPDCTDGFFVAHHHVWNMRHLTQGRDFFSWFAIASARSHSSMLCSRSGFCFPQMFEVSETLTRHERREEQFGRLLFLLLMLQMWWDAL